MRRISFLLVCLLITGLASAQTLKKYDAVDVIRHHNERIQPDFLPNPSRLEPCLDNGISKCIHLHFPTHDRSKQVIFTFNAERQEIGTATSIVMPFQSNRATMSGIRHTVDLLGKNPTYNR